MLKDFYFILLITVILAACNKTTNPSEDPIDSESDVDVCKDGSYRCDGNMIQNCDDGKWNDWNDCVAQQQICTVVTGDVKCFDFNEISSDSGLDSSEETVSDSDSLSVDSDSVTDSDSEVVDSDSVTDSDSEVVDSDSVSDSDSEVVDSDSVTDSDSEVVDSDSVSDSDSESGIDSDTGLPPIVGGTSGSTTRYWDCCKPHCGWHSTMESCDINNQPIYDYNAVSGCEGGTSYLCNSYAPFEVNSKVSYGWAAFNSSSTPCGECYQLDFKGELTGKQMIVQIINISDGSSNSFDLLIPGGGVGMYNGCSAQWGYDKDLGEFYGGFRATCFDNSACVEAMCQAAFGDKPQLMAGCTWFTGWFNNANNPDVTFKKVSCPSEITALSGI